MHVQKCSRPPIEPQEGSCCGQGCTNCVWTVYANEVVDYYKKKIGLKPVFISCGEQIEDIVKDIEAKVPNDNVRAFILAELRMKLRKS